MFCIKFSVEAGYQPKKVEQNKNEPQNDSNHDSSLPKYSLLLPPPNVTGNLHLGHALTSTIQDVLVRWKKQKGFDTVWIPGTDHAGIATQVVVEKLIMKEKGQTRHEIGREKFIEEVWKWKKEKGGNITKDLKSLGSSLDWSKEFFTLNNKQSEAVTEAFIRLFEEGIIYRGESLINWSCSLESAISDIEVENVEINKPTHIFVPNYEKKITFGQIFDISYKLVDKPGEIVVSTTRPETMLGDVAVAINPNDPRYSHLQKSDKLWHPFRNEMISVIFDETVDPEFGTGAVKITPAHDKNDFEMAKRHSLSSISVIDDKGLMIDSTFNEIPRFLARDLIITALNEMELFRGVRDHSMVLPVCSRSKDVIEYLIRPQWYVKCEEMSRRAVQAVENGDLKIYPENYTKDWNRWLLDCRDWCISRQLWWGHQIPAYDCSCNGTNKWFAARSKEEALEKSKKYFNSDEVKVVRDSDVLDTWFSSGLLPFSSLGWPEKSKDFDRYYPLDIMETGHDILFFWVARMVMLGEKLTGKLPFNKILLHGIVCDSHGRKMSKSLGNVISPESVINGASLKLMESETNKLFEIGTLSKEETIKTIDGQKKMFPNGLPECGTDALRFTLCSYNIKSHFINFDISDCWTNKLFFNKIWQATRYLLMASEKIGFTESDLTGISDMDKWILSRLADTVQTVEKSLEDYNFHLATFALKNFFYSNLCDVYLETTKTNTSKTHCSVLQHCLTVGLETMSIFTPFLSKELLSHLPISTGKTINHLRDHELEEMIEKVLEICQAIRQVKSQNNITRKHEPIVYLLVQSEDLQDLLENHCENIKVLSLTNRVQLMTNSKEFDSLDMDIRSTAGHLCSFGIKTKEKLSVNLDVNLKKLEKLENELEKLLKTVSTEGYKKSANEKVKTKHFAKVWL